MLGDCDTQSRDSIPIIDSFIFNFWSSCYKRGSPEDYPVLFNNILRALNECTRPCTRNLRYRLPRISCPGRQYPNTFSVVYHCGSSWQLPFVVNATTEEPATRGSSSGPTGTTRQQSSSRSTTRMRTSHSTTVVTRSSRIRASDATTATTTRRSGVPTMLREIRQRWQTSSLATNMPSMTTTTTTTSTSPVSTSRVTLEPSTITTGKANLFLRVFVSESRRLFDDGPTRWC